MKLVIDALSARQGGGQTYLYNLLASFPREGDEIVLLVPPSFRLDIEMPGLELLRLGRWAESPIMRMVWQRLALPRLLREMQADVFFCPGGIVPARAPKGCRTATMFRNMIPFDPVARAQYPLGYSRIRNWLLERAFLRSMTSSDLVIFIAQYAKQVVEARIPGRIRRSVVVPHGIASRFRVGGKRLDPSTFLPKGPYLLYVSSIDYYKAQLEVVQGFARLLQQRPDTQERLVIAGPENDREYARKVRAEIVRLGLGQQALVIGPVPYADLPALYQNASMHIFASKCENCPNILLESMASGRAVLCSNFPPMPEFGGQAVTYFDPRYPEELADRAAELLDNPKLREEMGERARARADKYDWNLTAASTRQVLAQLTEMVEAR